MRCSRLHVSGCMSVCLYPVDFSREYKPSHEACLILSASQKLDSTGHSWSGWTGLTSFEVYLILLCQLQGSFSVQLEVSRWSEYLIVVDLRLTQPVTFMCVCCGKCSVSETVRSVPIESDEETCVSKLMYWNCTVTFSTSSYNGILLVMVFLNLWVLLMVLEITVIIMACLLPFGAWLVSRHILVGILWTVLGFKVIKLKAKEEKLLKDK